MIVTLEPTGRFEDFEGVRCRIWKGKTDKGTAIEILREIKAERQLTYFDTRLL